jgi:HK97 gp10 family phage protein
MSALYTSKAGGTVATTTLGGRLRGEIHVEGPIQAGSIIAAKVVSPTYYAKYQEFGTRHNRATPYMRPAVAKLRISYRNEIVKALNRLNTTSGLSRGSRGGMYQ